jgi:F-type H+-transporting ATPase subunit b
MVGLLAAESSNDLIKVVPGLMIWTLIAFGITFFVLKKYAFGPIQKTIDDRRDRIRQAVEEADNARNEARELLEQNRAILAQARSESADILAETRKVADAQLDRAKQEVEAERQRRLVEEAVQGLDFSALEKGSAN